MSNKKTERFVVVCKTLGDEYLYNPSDVFEEKPAAMDALRELRSDMDEADMDSDDFEVVDCLVLANGQLVTAAHGNPLTKYDTEGASSDAAPATDKPMSGLSKSASNEAELAAHTGKFSIFNAYAEEYWKNDAGTVQIFESVEAAKDYIKFLNDGSLDVSDDEAIIKPAPEVLSPRPAQRG